MIRYCTLALVLLVATPAGATRVVSLTLPELVERSELVAEVQVVPDTASSFWIGGRIYTRQNAIVRALWKGRATTRTISVVTRGGRVGDIGQRVDGEVVLEAHGVAFLKYAEALDGYRVVAMQQGFVPLDATDDALRAELEQQVRAYAQ